LLENWSKLINLKWNLYFINTCCCVAAANNWEVDEPPPPPDAVETAIEERSNWARDGERLATEICIGTVQNLAPTRVKG
jgi:hypothetical protein